MTRVKVSRLVLLVMACLGGPAYAVQQGPCVDDPTTTQNECAPNIGTVTVVGDPLAVTVVGDGPSPPEWMFLSNGSTPSSSSSGSSGGRSGGRGSRDDTASPTTEAMGDCGDTKERGNPINVSTGAKVERETDFQSAGLGNFSLLRTYGSRNTSDGLFGRYWSSNFDYRLVATATDVTITDPVHGKHRFALDTPSGKYLSTEIGVWAEVIKNADGSYAATWLNEGVQRYSSAGKITAVLDPRGIGDSYTYDGSGNLYRVTSSSGKFIQFIWTGTKLTRVVDPNGNNYDYAYTADLYGPGLHRLASVTLPGTPTTTVTYHYENAMWSSALTGKSVAGVRFSNFSYDGQGRAFMSEHVGAVQHFGFVYNTQTAGVLQVTETNPYGKQSVYRFNSNGSWDVTGLPAGTCVAALASTTVDANGFTDKETAFNNRVTDFDFDANGRLARKTRGYGAAEAEITDQVWDAATGRLVGTTVVGDSSIDYAYYADGRLQSKTVKNLTSVGVANQDRQTVYTYATHPNGLLSSVSIDGPMPSDTITRRFSAVGDLLSIEDTSGVVVTYSGHNGLGQPAQSVDRYGVTLAYVYDARGRVLSTTRTAAGLSSTESVTYDQRGRVATATHADGTVQFFTYDSANRLTSIREPEVIEFPDPEYTEETLEKISTYIYNANSDLIQSRINRKYSFSFFDPDLHKVVHGGSTTGDVVTTFDFDELGRLKAVRGNNGQNIRYGYDESRNVVSITDSTNRATSIVYDALNREITRTDPKGGVARIGYDKGGRANLMTNQRAQETSYAYDGFGQLWRVQSPDAGVTTFAYDSSGRATGSVRADLTSETIVADAKGRVTSRQVGAVARSYTFDTCTNGMGRLCSAANASGTVQFSYTAAGKVSQQVNTILDASAVLSTGFTYDALGRLASVVYPDGKQAVYSYAGGKLTSVSANPTGSLAVVASGMKYQPFGPLTSLQFANGLYLTRNFDADGRLSSIATQNLTTGAVVQSLTLTRDPRNLVTGIGNGVTSALSQTFTYDELGRLSGSTRGDGVTDGYQYDAVGNRTSATTAGVTTSYSVSGVSSRLDGTSKPGFSRLWLYDSMGNANGFTGADGVAVGLHYDSFGGIDSSSRNAVTTYYQGTALGERLLKAGPSGTTYFIYAPNGQLLSENKGASWTNYVYAEGQLIGVMRDGAMYYVHDDQVGRPQLVTNAAKQVVWSANNYAFDRTVATSVFGQLDVGFPGQYFDGETGTWYNVNRDYDPTTGRYLQSDPIGLVAGWNTYAYVGSNPINYADPLGLDPDPLIWIGEIGEITHEISSRIFLAGTVGYAFGYLVVNPSINYVSTQAFGTTPAGLIYNFNNPVKPAGDFMLLDLPNVHCPGPITPPPYTLPTW